MTKQQNHHHIIISNNNNTTENSKRNRNESDARNSLTKLYNRHLYKM